MYEYIKWNTSIYLSIYQKRVRLSGVAVVRIRRSSKQDREHREIKRQLTTGAQLLIAICFYCPCFKVNHVCCVLALLPPPYMEMETQRTKENISLSPFLTLHLFLPSVILTKDGAITNVTLTGGNYPSPY